MDWNKVNFSQLPSPCYVIDCDILKKNLQIMKKHCDSVGIKPLIAIKGFPLALIYKEMSQYIYGLSASSLFEARLGEHLQKEIHIHTPAYKPEEMDEVFKRCDHVVFNSLSQWNRYKNLLSQCPKHPSIGLRINPEYSEVYNDKYNTSAPYSRFGITSKSLAIENLDGVDGFHLHVMYDHSAENFARVTDILINKFGTYLPYLSWINFGGGQRLADENFQINLLQENILKLTKNFGLDVYVEPCEAVITSCGYLVSTVLDIIKNQKQIAILDTSAVCHMPDVLETPYRPDIDFPHSSEYGDYSYLIAGVSCLAGDLIGEYKFRSPLKQGDTIIFSEMGAYTFAKENYFNGINHPSIVLYDQMQGFRIVKKFDYQDYESKYL